MPRLKHKIHFSDGKSQWTIPVTRIFNCHVDDEKQIFKELMEHEIKPRWPHHKGYVKGIELVKT